jgi:tetratricopeptide (TPR) repeat protein
MSSERSEEVDDILREGWQLENNKNFVKAEKKFSEAIALASNSSDAYAGRGEALFNLGKYTEAIADCTRALEYSPDGRKFSALVTRSLAYSRQGHFHEAVRDADLAIEIEPHEKNGYLARALAHANSL